MTRPLFPIATALVLLAVPFPSRSEARAPGTRPDTPLQNAQVVFSVATGLANGWQDYGWAPRKIEAGAPASLDMSAYGGWIIGNPNATSDFGGLKIKLRAPPRVGDFLEVRVEFESSAAFPHINVGPKHRRDLEGGWTEIWIPFSELNPKRAPFDRMVLRARTPLPKGTRILIEEIAWTAPDARDAARAERTEPTDVRMSVSCQQPGHRISPMIYGIAFKPSHDAGDSHQWRLGASARRWGGNPTSRYNWMLGNAWNTASDWFFRNVNYTPDPRYTYDRFLEDNLGHGMQTALTVPAIGWVAKDTESAGFPASVFGQQQYMEGPKAGNGMGRDGKPLTPRSPTLTSIPAPPAFVEKWVRSIRAADARDRGRSVHQYILDNEPALWNHTHRDVHPEPVTYDELRDRLIQYGGAVRKADPEAVIAGPAEWGWTGYLYSAKDQA
ncbi:MAG TPA: glycoside hydrolase family 44 protein, partial [Myxococcaceae bacterium]